MDWLAMSASMYPDRPAVIVDGRVYNYRQLNNDVERLGSIFHSRVQLGNIVGLRGHSSYAYVVAIHVFVRLGCVIVPFNMRLSAFELQVYEKECDVVFDVDEISAPFSSFRGDGVNLSGFSNDYTNYYNPKTMNYPFARLFTSGTSGTPKAVELTFGAIYQSAVASALRIGHLPTDRWLCVLPLYHVGGLSIIMRAALYGICVVLQHGFDLASVNRALDEEGVTLASFVPTMLYRLINARHTPPPHLRLVLLGGAAATTDLVERAHMAGFPIATTYGLTETASQVCTQLPDETRKKPGSVGKPVPFTRLKVIDEHGNLTPTGEIGEIIVQSPSLMSRYVNHPEATAKTLRDGWLHTGDLGYLDADGDLWLVQRRSDLIISGGENIYPVEVENALRSHPAISDAAVIGLPHPEWGQQVAVAIVLNSPNTIERDELLSYLRTRLAGYKLPRVVKIVDALPLTASGKVEKKAVLALFLND